ncbi:MAG: hypothetical protein AVDCRST_MAG40-669, partial [uncultured Gemmatimonadaceae bacterium]
DYPSSSFHRPYLVGRRAPRPRRLRLRRRHHPLAVGRGRERGARESAELRAGARQHAAAQAHRPRRAGQRGARLVGRVGERRHQHRDGLAGGAGDGPEARRGPAAGGQRRSVGVLGDQRGGAARGGRGRHADRPERAGRRHGAARRPPHRRRRRGAHGAARVLAEQQRRRGPRDLHRAGERGDGGHRHHHREQRGEERHRAGDRDGGVERRRHHSAPGDPAADHPAPQ